MGKNMECHHGVTGIQSKFKKLVITKDPVKGVFSLGK
jgi:hypothetical protein